MVGIGKLGTGKGFIVGAQSGLDGLDVFSGDELVAPAPEEQHGRLDFLKPFEQRDFVEGMGRDAASVVGNAAGQRDGHGRQRGHAAAHAVADGCDGEALLVEPFERSTDVRGEARIRGGLRVSSPGRHIRIAAFESRTRPMEQLRRDRQIAFTGETLRDVTNVGVHAENLLEDDESGARPARGPRDIGPHLGAIVHRKGYKFCCEVHSWLVAIALFYHQHVLIISMRKAAFWLALAAIATGVACAENLPSGQIIDDVQCADDASQHYALYLPSNFTPKRRWSVILAFDAGGRGRRAVERYQAAAEKYGYIVAGSNNSRNGPWEISLNAAKAMTADVDKRFPVDPKRVYTAGMSGGARVAMKLAMDSGIIAGVFASSAGFPDDFRTSVPFPVFGTAGTDDFNHQEMHELDRDLTSPHRVEFFEGGHQWLPVELAMDGVEWMELQAMKSGLRPRDQKVIDEILAKRVARAEAQKGSLERMKELESIAFDFRGFTDVSKFEHDAARLERQQDVKDALKAERSAEGRELQVTAEIYQLRDRMRVTTNFHKLKELVTQLLAQSKAGEDSSDRRIARRVLNGLVASSRSIRDPQFQELLNQIRPAGQGPPQ
jgi:dienelactone hydrolase